MIYEEMKTNLCMQMTPWLNLQLCRVFSSLSLTLLPIGPWSLAILLCQQLAAARR